MVYFIIEHPRKGILTVDSEVGAPRWSWSAARTSERAMRSFSEGEAQDTRETYTDPKTRDESQILRSPAHDEIEWTALPKRA